MIGWRVCLRHLVLIVEVMQHRSIMHALHLFCLHPALTVTQGSHCTMIRCIGCLIAIKFLLKNWLRTYFLAILDYSFILDRSRRESVAQEVLLVVPTYSWSLVVVLDVVVLPSV